MSGCALGQSPPLLQSELATHIANCAACRRAHERAQRAADLIDRGMELLVAGEPSPQFAARLYERMAVEPLARNFWARRFPIAASVLLGVSLAAVVVITYVNRRSYRKPEPIVTSLSSRAASELNAAPRFVGVTREPHPRKPGSDAHVSIAAHSEVLVAPGQMAALDRFDKAIQRYQSAGAHAIALHDDADQSTKVERLDVQPLEVQSIEVPAISEFTDSWGGF